MDKTSVVYIIISFFLLVLCVKQINQLKHDRAVTRDLDQEEVYRTTNGLTGNINE